MKPIKICIIDNLSKPEHSRELKEVLNKRLGNADYAITSINADVNGDGTVKPDELRYVLDNNKNVFDYAMVPLSFSKFDFSDNVQEKKLLDSLERFAESGTKTFVSSGNDGKINEIATAPDITVVGASQNESWYTPVAKYNGYSNTKVKANPIGIRTHGTSISTANAVADDILGV